MNAMIFMQQFYMLGAVLCSSFVYSAQQRVLLGSPVRRNADILKEFVFSLEHLQQSTCTVDYYFVDDNDDEQACHVLHNFAQRHENCLIIKACDEKASFVCDDVMHHWNDSLIDRVTRFKNSIIRYALEHEYDYLFLIDSDILLYPETIEHLIMTGKDIVSEVFWTRWQPQSDPLPQVWQSDVYTLSTEFIEQLKLPGIYEVGGLGACTLISKKALLSGVNFDRVHNVSFWGEDRHFCIRAVVLGFSLYVDTHLPAYHIYRYEDLAGVAEFKKKVELSRDRT